MDYKIVACLFLLAFIAAGSGCVSEPAGSDKNNSNTDIEEIKGL